MDDAELGTLTRQGDRWMLTFTRRLAHPREKVWRAVTEPEHLAAWYPQQIVGERRAGAPLRFVSSAGDGFDGQMLVFDPPEVMEFTWALTGCASNCGRTARARCSPSPTPWASSARPHATALAGTSA
jgi:uncharacterized protein YndB with AHSA1/START domain